MSVSWWPHDRFRRHGRDFAEAYSDKRASDEKRQGGESLNLLAELRDLAMEMGAGGLEVIPATGFTVWEEEARERARLGFDCTDWANVQPHPQTILPSARTILAGYVPYEMSLPPDPGSMFGWIHPGYTAWKPARKIADRLAGCLEKRGFRTVSNSNIPEKAALAATGLARYRRNGTVWLIGDDLAILPFTLITEAPLAEYAASIDTASPPEMSPRCDGCRACLSGCRTKALVTVARVNPAHCVTYHNELEEGIPVSVRAAMANRLMGCERCQMGCFRGEQLTRPEDPLLYLPDIASVNEGGFQERNEAIRKKYGVWWESRAGLVRAAAVGLGCSGRREAAEMLAGLLSDSSPLVRGHAAWGLGSLGFGEYRRNLTVAVASENDDQARQELQAAMAVLR